MSKFKAGDIVTNEVSLAHGRTYTYVRHQPEKSHQAHVVRDSNGTLDSFIENAGLFVVKQPSEQAQSQETLPEENAVSPNVYKFPNAEVRDISAHLTSFGGQAVQYVARATRLDGLVKGKPEQDIEKAIQVLQWELERLQEAS